MVDELTSLGLLRRRPRGWFWTDSGRAADLADIRSAGGSPVQLIEAETGRVVGTVDAGGAHNQAHPGAVYVHQGETWLVEDLDLEHHVAVMRRDEPAYSTTAREVTDISIVSTRERRSWGGCELSLGEVDVSHQVVSFLKRRQPGGEVLAEEPLDLPERSLRTTAVWWTVPDDVVAEAGLLPLDVPGAAHAAEHCSIGLLPLFATCDRWDIGGVSTARHADTGVLTVFVYDGHPGGAGFAERGFRTARRVAVRDPRGDRELRVRERLPVVHPVAQVRQPEQPARQGRRRDTARCPARGCAARLRFDARFAHMVFLGLALIILGGIAILSAFFVSEPGSGGELLGFEVTTFESFLVGVAAGAAILWGFSILKWGTKRGLAHRKERKELTRLNEKLERVESERRDDNPDSDTEQLTLLSGARYVDQAGRRSGRSGARLGTDAEVATRHRRARHGHDHDDVRPGDLAAVEARGVGGRRLPALGTGVGFRAGRAASAVRSAAAWARRWAVTSPPTAARAAITNISTPAIATTSTVAEPSSCCGRTGPCRVAGCLMGPPPARPRRRSPSLPATTPAARRGRRSARWW